VYLATISISRREKGIIRTEEKVKNPDMTAKEKMKYVKYEIKPEPVINSDMHQSNVTALYLRCFKINLLIKSSVLAARP
jgi:hypothetical protein